MITKQHIYVVILDLLLSIDTKLGESEMKVEWMRWSGVCNVHVYIIFEINCEVILNDKEKRRNKLVWIIWGW